MFDGSQRMNLVTTNTLIRLFPSLNLDAIARLIRAGELTPFQEDGSFIERNDGWHRLVNPLSRSPMFDLGQVEILKKALPSFFGETEVQNVSAKDSRDVGRLQKEVDRIPDLIKAAVLVGFSIGAKGEKAKRDDLRDSLRETDLPLGFLKEKELEIIWKSLPSKVKLQGRPKGKGVKA